MRVIGWILLLLGAVLAAAVAVANNNIVSFSFDPLPFVWDRPLYQFLFGSFLIGLLLGLITEWWRARRWRREAKARRREVESLTRENAQLKAAGGSLPAAPG